MKKRIFMLALVVGVMLSMCGSAWAGEYWYKIDSVTSDTIYDAASKINSEVTVSFTVDVAITNSSTNGYFQNANLVKWTVGDATQEAASDTFEVTKTTLANQTTTSSTSNVSYYLFEPSDSAGFKSPVTLKINVIGKLKKATGNIPIKVYLCNGGNDSTPVTSTTINTATEASGSANTQETIDIVEEFNYDSDTANPDGDAWDGKDPTFTSDPGDNQYAKAKAKLKTSKIDDFEAGKAKSVKVEFTGPVTEIDVYIAAKDALKLWPDDETVKGLDKKEGKIQLTQENIQKYNIPFRITSYDFSKNEEKLNGADPKEDKNAAKKDKDTAKNMTSTLTLAFNGGYFSYKGFPLTFSVTNEQMNKPAAKALKLNVKPYDKTPQWWYWDTRTNTTKTDTVDNVTDGKFTLTDEQSVNPTFTILDDKNKVISGAKVTSDDNGGTVTYTLSGLSDGQTATVKVTYDYEWEEEYKHVLTNKDKPEVAVALTTEGTSLEEADPNVFYMSGDYGPFNITEKGSSKNEAVTVTIVPPVYNYRGEINKDNSGNDLDDPSGYVAFSGTLALGDNKKEIKVPVTLTLLNPTVKKKAAAKVTVYGKIPAYFDEKKYPASEDRDGAGVVTTKTVEVGKVPSVKVKAAGSKTISYYVDANTLEELNAVGLSFDNKKGAVVDYPRGKKDTKPTMDADGNFSPLGIYIYATNGVGDNAVAFANVGITGGKPKVSTKEVKFSKTEHVEGKYKLIEVTLKNSTSADVKFSVSDTDAETLEKYGLALIQGSEIEELASDDTVIASGDTIADTKTAYLIITKKDDGSVKATLKEGKDYTLETVESATVIQIPATVTDTVYLRQGSSEQTGLAKYKNKAAIIVTNASDMADGVSKQQITITADNIGASATGKIKLTIEKASTETSALPGSNNAAPEAAGSSSATKTSGTAGLTYNGATPDADADAEAEAVEGTVTVGAPRTAADLTADQQALLAEKGYTVVAVLPEITADAEGQYNINVDIDEEAPEGAKLIWLAFPKNAPASEDDEIVDFYDEAGTPVEGVPASHKIIASPWLREAVTYEPVIAIEAK